jgi:hypothetical protein
VKRRSFLAMALGTLGALPFLRADSVSSAILRSPLEKMQTIIFQSDVCMKGGGTMSVFVTTPKLGRIEKLITIPDTGWVKVEETIEVPMSEFAEARFGFGPVRGALQGNDLGFYPTDIETSLSSLAVSSKDSA